MDYKNGHTLACVASGIGGVRGCSERSVITIGMTFEELAATWRRGTWKQRREAEEPEGWRD